MDPERKALLARFLREVRALERVDAELKQKRESVKAIQAGFKQASRNFKVLQTVGMIVGEVVQRLDAERCIIKSSAGPRYVVGCKPSLAARVELGARVCLDTTTLTIMEVLPREVDPTIFTMSLESHDKVDFEHIGGLQEQLRQIREVIELPLTNPELFEKVGITCPKGVLLYGPPGTGKTLIAKALASQMRCTFLKVVASAIVDKYIGESARVIREMFTYAKEHTPCIIFIDEIDAIGGRRSEDGSSSDREIQRTLMELLHLLDGFKDLVGVKVIMATNRPDILDPALTRPGRLDRKIEIPLPSETARLEILKIHAKKMAQSGPIDFESVAKFTEDFNGADLNNVCTEAGICAIREERNFVTEEDFMKAVRRIAEATKHVSRLRYNKI